MFTSMDSENTFEEIQYPFVIKTLLKLRIEGNFLRASMKKPTAKIILSGKKLNMFPARSGSKFSLLFNIVLKVLTCVLGQENKIKHVRAGEEEVKSS